MNLKRILKYTLVFVIGLLLIIAFGGYFIAEKYESEITLSVIGELNKQIETEVEVDDINFSILRNFPKASLQFDNIFIHSTKNFLKENPNRDTLLWAKRMSLDFNLIDVFHGKYVLTQLQLKRAVVKMQIGKKSLDNFHFTKDSNEEKDTKFSIELEKVILKNVDYRFYNYQMQHKIALYAKQFVLKGNLSDNEFGLSTSGSLILKQIKLKNIEYVMYPNTSLNVDLWVNNSKVKVKKGSVKVGNEYLDVNGEYWFNNQSFLDLNARSNSMTINNILQNLPKEQQALFEKFKAKGQLAFDLSVKGEVARDKIPEIEINANVNNAELLNIENNLPLKNLNFSVHFLSAKSILEIKDFNGNLYESSMSGNFTIQNFKQPNFKGDIKVISDLKEIKQFFELDSLQNFQGQVQANVNISGRLNSSRDISKTDIRTFKANGDVHVNDANATFVDNQKQNIHHFNADLRLENNNIIIDSLDFRFGHSNVKIKGKAYNTLAFVLLDNQTLNINGDVLCDSLNMRDLMTVEDGGQDSLENVFNYPENIAARLNLNIGEFTYDKFEAEQVYASFYLNKDFTEIRDFRMKTSGGEASGQMHITPQKNGSYTLESSSNLKDINIEQIMFELNDFGQKSISYKNLNGKLDAVSQVKAVLNSNLTFVKEELNVVTNFNVKDGALTNYKPLYSLSKFIKLSDLETIKFNNFHNVIEINNSTLYIPKMEIQSTAINLSMSGQHGFDNKFVYRMKVLLSEVLGRKARENNKENKKFNFIEDDNRGKTSLFLIIKGDANNIKFRYDGGGVKEHIKEEFKEEKLELKTILNEEFGLFKKDSAVIKQKNKPKEKSTKKNFKIEWDDE